MTGSSRPQPASRLQNRLWFFSQLYPDLPFFTIPVVLELTGAVDPAGVRTVLGELLSRHDALRTCLIATELGPQPLLIEPTVHLDVTDLRARDEPVAAWTKLHDDALSVPLDLARGPLLRALLARIDESRWRLGLLIHHATVDGVSVEVLLRELGTAYGAWELGHPMPAVLGEPPPDYASFAAWHSQAASEPGYGRAREYWTREFAGLGGDGPGGALLVTDRPRTPSRTFEVRTVSGQLPAGLGERLQAFSRDRRVTPMFVFAAALAVLLNAQGGGGDVVLATPWTLRRGRWLDGTVGMFVNTIPLRIRMGADPTFDDVVAAVRSASLDAMDHCLVPYDEIVALANPVRDPSRPPLTAVCFQVLETTEADFPAGSLRARRLPARDSAGDFDQVWDLICGRDGPFAVSVTYTADIFDEATVSRSLAEIVRVLGESLGAPRSLITQRAVAAMRRTGAAQMPAAVAALDSHPGVRESVLTWCRTGERPELVAFAAVTDPALSPACLRAHLAWLPASEQPTWFVLVDELPRTTDGAIDRVELDLLAAEVVGVPATGDAELEASVREVWEEHLGVVVAHLDATFFDLDGHSLIAVRIAASLQRRHGRPVPVRAIFENPTVRTLAAYLAETAPAAGHAAIETASTEGKTRLAADLGEASDEELQALAILIGEQAGAGK